MYFIDSSPQSPDREELPRNRPTQTVQPQPRYTDPCAVGVMTRPPASLTQTVPAQSVARSTSAASHTTSATVRTKPKAVVQGIERDSEYIPLEQCTSGNSMRRPNRQESVSSVPDDMAPPPPVFKHGEFDNEAFNYDVPPSSGLDEDDVYKVPPSRSSQNVDTLDAYDVPPPTRNSPSTPRSSSSESQKVDSAYSSQGLTYDIPPVRPDGGLSEDDVYDVPPSHAHDVSLDDIPPGRPPKPGHLQTMSNSQEAYMNIPTNSKAFEKASKTVDINSIVAPPPAHSGMVLPPVVAMAKVDLYDYPKASQASLDQSKQLNGDSSDKLLMSTPPPPTVCGSGDHRYINTTGNVETHADMYLPMDSSDLSGKPRKSSSTDNEVEYTDMTGKNSFDDSFEKRSSPVYDHPPPSRPDMPPPRPVKPAGSKSCFFINYSYYFIEILIIGS